MAAASSLLRQYQLELFGVESVLALTPYRNPPGP
jgi:hypothetical protein